MFKAVHSIAIFAAVLALPAAVWADISNPGLVLSSGQILNLDTGAVANTGDLLWDGTQLTPQGSAIGGDLAGVGLTGSLGYGGLTSALLSGFATGGFAATPITPALNDVLGVKTNGGHYAKLLVTAISGGSITLEFTTFGATSGGGGPTVGAVANNYSNIPPGAPNYGIAPGSLFILYGSGFSASNDIPKNPFPLAPSLNGTSVSVTVGGKTVTPGLIYVTPTQITGVLPSTTPTGKGTLTVTNGKQTSTAVEIDVVDSAFGTDTLTGSGSGGAVVSDPNYKLISYSNSAKPGEYLIFWGSGVGSDTSNDDKSYPLAHQNNLTNIKMTAYVGGVKASIYYRGRSQYPGVDQVIVIVPQGVTFGCNVSVWFLSGANNTASNFTTIPVSADGGACSDPNSVFGGVDITALSGQATVNTGYLAISQDVGPAQPAPGGQADSRRGARLPLALAGPRAIQTSTTNGANGFFQQIRGADLATFTSYRQASLGSCVVWQYTATSTPPLPPYKSTGLDAGTITVSGNGQTAQLQTIPQFKGEYQAQLSANFIPSTGGTFTFNGTGGADIGKITNVSVNFGNPLFVWNEEATITTVTRSAGVTVTWTGGIPGTWVEISGNSTGNGVYGGFDCLSLVDPHSFTVPAGVLSALPAGTGSMSLLNFGSLVKFTASHLDLGYAFAEVFYDSGTLTYQ